MKFIKFLFTILLLSLIGYTKVHAANSLINGSEPDANDTTANLKSNIVIFQMIPAAPATNPSNTSGSLKKAGKVARTSNSHTSIESILYKKKGI